MNDDDDIRAVPAQGRPRRDARLARAVARARFAARAEALGPALGPGAAALGLYLAGALSGALGAAPLPVRQAAAFGLAAALAWSAARARRALRSAPRSDRRAALRQVEAASGVPEGAFARLLDRPAEASEPAGRRLWAAARRASARLRAAHPPRAPRVSVSRSDPGGLLRAGLLASLAAVLLSRAETPGRLAAAARLAPAGPPADVALWIEPPDYTGRPPIVLEDWSGHETIETPVGSVLRVAVRGPRRAPRLSTPSGRVAFAPRGEGWSAAATLDGDGRATLRGAGRARTLTIDAVADAPPEIVLVAPPAPGEDGGLEAAASLADDYGIVRVEARLRLAGDQDLPPDHPDLDPAALAREDRLPVERVGARILRLAAVDHPWAGLAVDVAFVVTDAAGQSAETSPARAVLPARAFQNAKAKAVVEQRRVLAVSASAWPRAARALEAITAAPEIFAQSASEHLKLRHAYWRLIDGPQPAEAEGDTGFEDAVEDFWGLALALEDGAVETARRALLAAQEALRDALERGAPEEEIEGLVEALRAAMRDYVAALETVGRSAANDGAASETLATGDLDAMLDQIRELSKAGEDRAARDALADLSEILNALRSKTASGRGGGEGSGEAGSRTLDEMGEIIGRQRALADETYERRNAPPVEPGARTETGDLAERQDRLADELEALADGAQGESGRAAEALREALGAMREAAGALGEADGAGEAGGGGAGERAAGAQGRALETLRGAARAFAEDARRAAGRDGSGEGEGAGGRPGGERDPLGRAPYAGPGEASGLEATRDERVRDLLMDLRDRLADPDLPPEDRAYIERLLRRF